MSELAYAPEVALDLDRLAITVETEVDDEVAELFYALYQDTFEPLAAMAAARQTLHRHEFLEEMRDPRVMKYVAREPSGRIVGMTTLTRDLDTVPWISPQYYARMYPEQTRRNAVFYLGFTLVHPHRRQGDVFKALVLAVMELVGNERGVCGWDICNYNEESINFSRGIELLVRRHIDATIQPVDAQTYHACVVNAPPRVRARAHSYVS